jgi:hypothetical protein
VRKSLATSGDDREPLATLHQKSKEGE